MSDNKPKSKRRNRGGGGFGGGPGMQVTEKAKDFKGTFKKLTNHLSNYKYAILLVCILAAASSVFSILGPKIMGNATTEIFTGLVSRITGGPGIDFPKIGSILLFVLGLYFVSALLSFIQGLITSRIAQRVSYNLRADLSEKINKLPMSYFDTTTTGDVLSRITNDVDTLTQSLNQSLTQLISSATSIIGVFVMMLTISWVMTLVAVFLLPISLILVSFIAKRTQKYFRSQQEYTGDLNGWVEESYGGHNVIKLFNNETKSIETFEEMNARLAGASKKSQFYSGIIMPIMTFVGNLGYVGVSILGGILAINGTITVGNIQSFIQYVRNFTQPINQIAQISGQIQSTIAGAERIFEFLDEEEEPDVLRPAESYKDDISGYVDFENVAFGYMEDKEIIHDFSLHVEPGRKVAIVGPTGAGKTTLIKLLMRFYDVNNGSIKLDGKDIREYERTGLRRCFGMVLQDTWLFSGTIMDNIRYGNLEATDEMVIEAAKAARADHFIRTLPGGYKTEINEEATNVSQGQKQLLTIARAILADPKILILDEATSSVDTRTELLIQQAMDALMEGKTSFIIAHRLSTIRNADTILVLRDGDVVEQGNHEDLLAQKGFYAELYNAQFENPISA